jgi:type I restriction enzyme R subunit
MKMSEYSEDELVEQSAISVFVKDLKYTHLNCYEEEFPKTIGRETKAEVVLVSRLTEAIKKLNSGLPDGAIKDAISQLLQNRSRLLPVKANQEVHKLIKDGIKISVKTKKGYEPITVKIIDFEKPENNDFFIASQLWITGDIYTRRPDMVVFVNGIPLIVIEVKARDVDVKRAFEDNITDYLTTIPHLFWYNAFILISNGRESKIGSMTSGYEHYADWKKIYKENEAGSTSIDTLIKGTCDKSRFLDLLENFILFTTAKGKQIKIVAKNHQYLGVNNAIDSFKERKKNGGRLGVFWHTQGSGKSYSMIFFSQKVLRKYPGNYTFVVVTDRDELDTQIYQNFQNAEVVTEKEVQATSGANLKQLLRENHRLVFTLIHKFNTEKGQAYPKLSDRDDIIVMTDEAHRTQYDILALNMRTALPNAAFIGFTGTPLIEGEEKTKATFGDYVSVYNFRESIQDNATVPLYYEKRVPELQIINPQLNEDIYETIDSADLDEMQEEKLSREFSKEYQVITRDDRLNAIAEDIVTHFMGRGYDGKAMVVSIDKLTAARMYEKVRYFWGKEIENLKNKARKAGKEEVEPIKAKIKYMEDTDMALVISQEQNEIKKFKEIGFDIIPHRKRIVREQLAEKFKDPDTNFRIVFLCNMWITGFDVPSLSTIYLDKPMKNHSLMQTIARANRVFEDKTAGFIVDYINVFRNLKNALAIYAPKTASAQIDLPIESKEQLVKELRKSIADLNKFLKEKNINVGKTLSSAGLDKNALLDKALSELLENEKTKKAFLTKAGLANKIYRNILPHKDANQFGPEICLYDQLVKEIRSRDPDADISGVMRNIQRILDKSIASKGYVSAKGKGKIVDISKIDFEALEKRLEEKRTNSDVELLKNVLSYKLREMIRINSTRIDFQERYQELVNDYNLGSLNNDEFFKKLTQMSKEISAEEQRHFQEGLTEEQLALFDKLKKPDLTDKEKEQVKTVAKELLAKLEATKLVLDWRKKQQARAAVKVEIEKELDKELPPSYTEKEYHNKCELVFQHIYDNYFGERRSAFHNNYVVTSFF